MLGVGGPAVPQQALVSGPNWVQTWVPGRGGSLMLAPLMVGRVGWGSMVPGLLLLQLCAHRLCPCEEDKEGASAQEQISGPRPHLPIPKELSCVGLAMPFLLHLLDSNPFVDCRLVPLLMS